jgi:hypothetical protein
VRKVESPRWGGGLREAMKTCRKWIRKCRFTSQLDKEPKLSKQ